MSIYNQYFGDAGPEQSLVLFLFGIDMCHFHMPISTDVGYVCQLSHETSWIVSIIIEPQHVISNNVAF